MIPREDVATCETHDRGIVGAAQRQEGVEGQRKGLLLLRNTDDFAEWSIENGEAYCGKSSVPPARRSAERGTGSVASMTVAPPIRLTATVPVPLLRRCPPPAARPGLLTSRRADSINPVVFFRFSVSRRGNPAMFTIHKATICWTLVAVMTLSPSVVYAQVPASPAVDATKPDEKLERVLYRARRDVRRRWRFLAAVLTAPRCR